jgi:hypothetical protein
MENSNNDVERVVSSLKSEQTATVTNPTAKKVSKKKKLVINWPTNLFSIADLQSLYPKAVNITLRFRINQAKERGQLVEVGKNITDIGRPTLLFATTPVTKEKLKSVDLSQVVLNDAYANILSGTTTIPVVTHSANVIQKVTLPQTPIVTTTAPVKTTV